MTRETASERRAREVREAHEAQLVFQSELPMTMLRLLARANSLDVTTKVLEKDKAIQTIFVWTMGRCEMPIRRVCG